LLFLSVFLIVFSTSNQTIYLADFAFAGGIVGIVFIIFSRFMPRRTALGREMYRRIKGYRLFIDKAENYRQKFFEKRNMFNEILPYVIVFGLTKKFAKALDKMGVKPNNPTWYYGAHSFNPILFSDNINSFSNSVSRSIASAPSSSGFSSGGGFSGGGFGGGGGGSW
ncbi:MAG TPA: hypothetical protein VHE53_01625, partial [Patescibacteria group bacterium]|nr:hypothetical protein [Patescibacteria group bacterium]